MATFVYKWEWDLKSDPEAIWDWIADTNRFNKDVGLPFIKENLTFENKRRKIAYAIPFFRLSVEETPFEWIKPFRFGVLRKFSRGPISEMIVKVELLPKNTSGTKLIYSVIVKSRNFLGTLIVPIAMSMIKKRFEEVFRKYDESQVRGEAKWISIKKTSSLGKKKFQEFFYGLIKSGVDENLARNLALFVDQADDLTLMRLRPYVVAEYLNLPKKKVVEAFLAAVRAGFMGLRWELICPSCRGPAESLTSLKDIKSKTHCSSCLIDFDVNFDKSVEVIFKLDPKIKKVNENFFCIGGPAITQHIVVQELIKSGEQRTVEVSLKKKIYRVRTLKLRGGQFFKVEDEGSPEAIFIARDNGWFEDMPVLRPKSSITLINSTSDEQLFIVEEFGWDDKILTANEIFTFQRFRELFSGELLKYGESVSIESLVVAFTDLKNSSRIYEKLGDARAFDLVMKHFDILRKNIDEGEGAIVKTEGDAVMAVFRSPSGAIYSFMKSQKELLDLHPDIPLKLKVGIHIGSCIAISLKDNLDYFGRNINFAARLPKFSQGDDIIISDELYNLSDVKSFIEENKIDAEGFFTEVDGNEVRLWRLKNNFKI
jgi:class 3 adenylate cyclase